MADQKKPPKVFIICMVILFLAMSVYVIYDAISYRISYTSPLGDYEISAVWIDKGGWGYSGKIYLIDRTGFFPKFYYTGCDVPASYGWSSDTEFYINGNTFHVKDLKN